MPLYGEDKMVWRTPFQSFNDIVLRAARYNPQAVSYHVTSRLMMAGVCGDLDRRIGTRLLPQDLCKL